MRFSALLCLVLLLAGCASGPSQPYVQEVKGVRVFSGTADLQQLITKDHGVEERVCASRMPDVADTRSVGVGLGLPTENAKEGSTQGALDLGGRSPSVLIAREFMYRACELSMNLNLDKEDALQMFYRFLDASVEVAKAQSGAAGSAPLAAGAAPVETSGSATPTTASGSSSATSTWGQ